MPESFERGALTEAVYYVLLSLFEANYGYGIMRQVEKMSGGRVKLGAGTLYGALNSLTAKNWIKFLDEYEDNRKKKYIITDIGREAVLAEVERLKELAENGETVTAKLFRNEQKFNEAAEKRKE